MTKPSVIQCDYFSTACEHATKQPELFAQLHEACATEGVRWDGTHKVPATCKWCVAPCSCECHQE